MHGSWSRGEDRMEIGRHPPRFLESRDADEEEPCGTITPRTTRFHISSTVAALQLHAARID